MDRHSCCHVVLPSGTISYVQVYGVRHICCLSRVIECCARKFLLLLLLVVVVVVVVVVIVVVAVAVVVVVNPNYSKCSSGCNVPPCPQIPVSSVIDYNICK